MRRRGENYKAHLLLFFIHILKDMMSQLGCHLSYLYKGEKKSSNI
jgi:hypothetical protein